MFNPHERAIRCATETALWLFIRHMRGDLDEQQAGQMAGIAGVAPLFDAMNRIRSDEHGRLVRVK